MLEGTYFERHVSTMAGRGVTTRAGEKRDDEYIRAADGWRVGSEEFLDAGQTSSEGSNCEFKAHQVRCGVVVSLVRRACSVDRPIVRFSSHGDSKQVTKGWGGIEMREKKLLSIVVLTMLAAPALPAQEAKQKLVAAQKANAAAARQFTWTSRTELKLKGESKSVKLDQVRYDANGQVVKTPIDTGAQQQQQQPSGGRLKQKIVAKKKEEFGEMIKGLAALVTSYAHMSQDKLQAFSQSASFKEGQGQDAGTIQISGQPAIVPGDSLTVWADKSTMLFRRIAITTSYDKDPVSVACTYATGPGGLSYMAKATLDYPSKNVQVIVDNYNYQSLGGSASLQPAARPTAQQPAPVQDPGWPRQRSQQGNRLITYQPQVEEWKNFQDLRGRMAFSLSPAGGKAVVGIVYLSAHTDVDTDQHMVYLSNIQITKTDFPSLDPATTAQMDQLVRGFLPPTFEISLHRLTACVPKQDSAPTVRVKNDPPVIFVSNSPAILLFVDGQPVRAAIKNTSLEFVVNTTWPLFVDKPTSKFYLLVDKQWMTADGLEGKWAPTSRLPKDMSKLPQDPEWASLQKVIPPAPSSGAAPNVFYSTNQAEVILFDGKPAFSRISGTQLLYATNTTSCVFTDSSTMFYYLSAGRWFRANSLEGPWSYATNDLPADFARIPAGSPASRVLSSVPGTDEAKDAVLLAQVPTTMVIDPVAAAAQAKVTYDGDPQFKPIEGTTLSYAANTQDKVIKYGDVYYLCLQGVWFMSTTAQGPWQTASSVPQEIYTIPASSPVYNVTYVTQTTTSSGAVESSYTAGYMGAFMVGTAVGLTVAYGTGYYYPPYYGYPVYGYPVYHPYAVTYGYGAAGYYNTATGAYGVAQTAYGPYGSATRAAAYNPYTGTAARGASVSTPYGSRSAAQAYNPYTGAYAATRQGSSPTAQWGSSVVTKGNQAAYAQHYSTAQGTVGSVQTSSGAKAVGANTAYGSGGAVKTSSGDMYAAKDGNVYKNTGSGWQSASGSNASRSSAAASGASQQRAPTQEMNQEAQNRQRGAAQSQQFQNIQRSGGGGGGFGGGGGGGGGRSFGGGRGGGRR